MGHAVDRDLLCLVQDEVKDLIKDCNTIHSQLNLHNKQIAQLGTRSEEIGKVLKRLMSFKTQLSIRLQAVEEKVDQLEQTQTKTDHRVGELEQSQTNTVCQVELLKDSHTKTADEVELLSDEVQLLKKSQTETAAKANQLDQRWAEVERIGLQLRTQKDKPGKLCLRLRY